MYGQKITQNDNLEERIQLGGCRAFPSSSIKKQSSANHKTLLGC